MALRPPVKPIRPAEEDAIQRVIAGGNDTLGDKAGRETRSEPPAGRDADGRRPRPSLPRFRPGAGRARRPADHQFHQTLRQASLVQPFGEPALPVVAGTNVGEPAGKQLARAGGCGDLAEIGQ